MSVVRFVYSDARPPAAASLLGFTERTGVEIETEEIDAALLRTVAGEIVTGQPTWDLMVLDEVIVTDLIRRGVLEPLGRRAHHDGVDLDDFPQAAIDRFRASDVVYAIPAAARSNVLIYRTDLIERYEIEIPTTWDDLKSTAVSAQLALREDGIDDVFGVAVPGLAGYEQNFVIVGSTLFPSWGWQWNRGRAMPPLVHEPATVDALSFFAALLTEAGPHSPARVSGNDARQFYAEGKSLFLIDTPRALVRMRRAKPDGVASRSAIAMVPLGPTGRPEPGLGSPAFCIPRSSPACEQAWELLRHLISPAEMVAAALEGDVETARVSILSSDDYAVSNGLEFQGVMQRTSAYARINRPLIPNGWDFGDIVGVAAESVIAGDRSADEALRVAQAVIDGMSWTS